MLMIVDQNKSSENLFSKAKPEFFLQESIVLCPMSMTKIIFETVVDHFTKTFAFPGCLMHILQLMYICQSYH